MFKEGNYENNRVVLLEKELLLNGTISWKDCWKGYNNEENSNDFYNSTFVIPMSITSDNEDHNSIFYNKFFSKNDNNKLTSNTRVIWGFLCFDSKQKNYFNEIEKIYNSTDLGFIIADILSIYLVFFYNYTSASETIQKYEEMLYKK